jgi:hypothetical protein
MYINFLIDEPIFFYHKLQCTIRFGSFRPPQKEQDSKPFLWGDLLICHTLFRSLRFTLTI